MHPPHLLDISITADIIDPPKHDAQIRHHPHEALSQERKRRRHGSTDNFLEDLARLAERHLVARQVDGDVLVLGVLGPDESLGGEISDVGGADELNLAGGRQRRLPHGGEQLAHHVRRHVLHEGDGAEDGVAHLGAVVRLRFEVLLDVVLADEVRDVGGVGVAVGTVALDGGVDEVVDVVGERGVGEGFALLFFRLGRGAAAEGDLDAEDAPDGSGGFGEDGGTVVQVAFDELDVGAFLRERGRRCGGGVAGEGENGEVFGVGRCEESVNDGAALFAGGTGDEEGFRHVGLCLIVEDSDV